VKRIILSVTTLMIPIMLISGIPGCGKTTFGTWLAQNRSYVHIDLEHDGLDRYGVRTEWERFFGENDLLPFIQALYAFQKPVVLDWGYPPCLWPRIAQLSSGGITPWWFEADRLAARSAFLSRADLPVWAFDSQYAQIAAAWNELAPLYEDRIVHVLAQDASFQPHEAIAHRILRAA